MSHTLSSTIRVSARVLVGQVLKQEDDSLDTRNPLIRSKTIPKFICCRGWEGGECVGEGGSGNGERKWKTMTTLGQVGGIDSKGKG